MSDCHGCDRVVSFWFSTDVEDPIMEDLDFFVEINSIAIDVDADGYKLAFYMKLVSLLVDNNQFFMFSWVDFNVIEMLAREPIVLFE